MLSILDQFCLQPSLSCSNRWSYIRIHKKKTIKLILYFYALSKYLITRFTHTHSASVEFSRYCDQRYTSKEISGRLHIITYIRLLRAGLYVVRKKKIPLALSSPIWIYTGAGTESESCKPNRGSNLPAYCA